MISHKVKILFRLADFINSRHGRFNIKIIETNELKKNISLSNMENLKNPVRVKVIKLNILKSIDRPAWNNWIYKNKTYDFNEYFKAIPEMFIFDDEEKIY